jgi:RNA polymerase sigma-70 factor, ECF subfamily
MAEIKPGFVHYYNEFKNKIFAYFFFRVGFDRKVAEDLTSEAFLKAYKNFDSFDETKPFQPWIFRISHNHLVNYYKTSKREVPIDTIAEPLKYTQVEIEERFEVNRVLNKIDAMDDEEKEVLLLKFAQELSNAEIAELLDKEDGAIRTQISRCLTKLRRILNQ